MSQHLIDVFLFLWSTFHDFLYGALALYGIRAWRQVTGKKSVEERVEDLEEALNDHIKEG